MEAAPVTLRLTWDPALLRLERIVAADGPESAELDFGIRNDTGEAVIKPPGSTRASKAGDLATLSFIAIRKGTCKVMTAAPETGL